MQNCRRDMTDIQETKTPIRVLIVDDDVPTRIGLRAIFSSEPDMVVVGESADGYDAVRQSDRLAPDVVLMDIQLGERMAACNPRSRLALDPLRTCLW